MDRSEAPLMTIGEIQGVVRDDANAREHNSPFVDEFIRFRAVVYQKQKWPYARDGFDRHGFLLQNKKTETDKNPKSSDGIFIYTSKVQTIKTKSGDHELEAGDYLEITGKVSGRFGSTEIREPQIEAILGKELNLEEELEAFVLDIPDTKDEADRYWERREGMRCIVPAGSIVLGHRKHDNRSGDVMLQMILANSVPAQALDPYAQRVFRDPHPLDDKPRELFDNDNPYRFIVSSMGLRGTADSVETSVYPCRTFDRSTKEVYGGITYHWDQYKVSTVEPFSIEQTINPAENGAPEAPTEDDFSIATYNVENLYDFEDDPYDPCDFEGNKGIGTFRPPFDYVPTAAGPFELRVKKLAQHIHEVLHSPDLILLQELEDQDIFSHKGGRFVKLKKNNADGQNDSAQRIAIEIKKLGGPKYLVANDRDAADDRGIIAVFMYRKDTLTLLNPRSRHFIFGKNPNIKNPVSSHRFNKDVENPKAFNGRMMAPNFRTKDNRLEESEIFSRATQIAAFQLKKHPNKKLYALNNHFSSRPDRKIERRREQAALNARLIRTILNKNASALIVMGGDLNVYPRPDDPLPEQNSDQLAALYKAKMLNIYDALILRNPSGAYSYVYKGQAQTLDHLFISPALSTHFSSATVAHLNADHSMVEDDEHYHGASDHDPVLARFRF